MPIIAQAAKKLRRDNRRTVLNESVRNGVKQAVKKARKHPSAKTIQAAFSVLDKATKRHIVHPNTASRTKSRLAALLKK